LADSFCPHRQELFICKPAIHLENLKNSGENHVYHAKAILGVGLGVARAAAEASGPMLYRCLGVFRKITCLCGCSTSFGQSRVSQEYPP
jgi:hypothetical protein